MTNEQERVLDIIQELIDEITLPPVSPTLTKDDLVEKLNESWDIIADAEFKEGEDEPTGIDETDLTDLRDDIDEATDMVDHIRKILKYDSTLRKSKNRRKFLLYYKKIVYDLKSAEHQLDWLL